MCQNARKTAWAIASSDGGLKVLELPRRKEDLDDDTVEPVRATFLVNGERQQFVTSGMSKESAPFLTSGLSTRTSTDVELATPPMALDVSMMRAQDLERRMRCYRKENKGLESNDREGAAFWLEYLALLAWFIFWAFSGPCFFIF